MDAAPPSAAIVTQELRVVDAQGRLRLLMSAATDAPVIVMKRADGSTALEATLSPGGQPSVVLSNADASGPVATLELDDKGAHVKFDRPGKASSYVFLNNAGASGIVLVAANGARGYGVVLNADGSVKVDAIDSHAGSSPAPPTEAR